MTQPISGPEPVAAPDAVADPAIESLDGSDGGADPSNTPIEELVADLDPDDDVLTTVQGIQADLSGPMGG